MLFEEWFSSKFLILKLELTDQTYSSCNLQFLARSIQWWQNAFTTVLQVPRLSSQWRFLHHLPSHQTEGLCPRRAGSGMCFMKVWGCVLFCTVLITVKEILIFWAEHSTCHLVRSLDKFCEKANILGFFPPKFSFELKETCFVQVTAFPW